MYQTTKPQNHSTGKKTKLAKLYSLALLILLGTSIILASFTRATNEKSIKTVPFKGTIITTFTTIGEPPLQVGHVLGTGNLSHLGKTSFEATVTLETTGDIINGTGTGTFTAANGDEFQTTYSGQYNLFPDGTAKGQVTHHITGGTGRFAGISGTFTADVVNDLNKNTGIHVIEGAISY